MIKQVMLLLCFSLVFFACPKVHSRSDELQGKWYMDSYTAFLPELPDIKKDEIIWTFQSGQKLLVENSIEDKYPFILKSGTYEYQINNAKITIDNQTYDYRFENGKLILSDKPELDGPIFSFIKTG